MSKVVRVQEGDYKILLGKNGTPNNFIIDTNYGSINAQTGEVIINGNLVVTGNAPSPEVSNVLYVTVDGNDANDGKGESPKKAKRTIKSAVEAATEGTTIFVRSGEYYENNPIRLPPKISIVGDNLRRTILRPLNGPRKLNIANFQRTNGTVTITTTTNHELRLDDRVRVIIPDSTNPTVREDNIIDIECANIIEITNSTTFKYKDNNLTNILLTSTTLGTVEQGVDFFLVNSQNYIAQLVFKGFQAPGYCLNIDKDAIVDTSPYIQNCSNINGPWLKNGTEWLPFITEQPDVNGNMVTGARPLRDDEIDPAQLHIYGINDRGAGGGMLIDGDRYSSESPLKSMVADAFTQVAQGAVGFHITNFGYMQLVSCFSVFCDKAFYTTNGGYLSISNSVIDFGNYGFIADGYYPTPYATGVVTQSYFSSVASVSVTSEGKGYLSEPNAVVEPPSTPAPTGVQATVIVNIDFGRRTVVVITPDNPGGGYTEVPTITIDPPFTPYVNWSIGLAVNDGEYVLFNLKEYQVIGNGNLGASGPVHSTGQAANGTVTLLYVGTQATATVRLASNTSINIGNINEKPQVGSIAFIGDNPNGYYVKGTSNSNLLFKFNEIKCRRDIKYIVDAVLADAIFNTNFRTIYAGRAYLRSYSSKVLNLQKTQTLNAIEQTKLELNSYPGLPSVGNTLNNLFDIIINIITTENPNVVQPIFTPLFGRTSGFVEAANILQLNKQFVQDQIINFIDSNAQSFQYDEAKCQRDVEIIVNAVLDDLVLGTNYLSKTAGISYLRSYANTVLENQKIPTRTGIERARDLVIKYLQNEYDSEVIVNNLFDDILNIIEAGNIDSLPLTTYTNPDETNFSVEISDARNIELEKLNIINNVIDFIITNLDPANIINYSERLCRRDLGYILDGIIFDLLYGGNSATVNIASSFYAANGDNVVSTQILQHKITFNYLKNELAIFAPNTIQTSGYTIGHSTLIDIIINGIELGQSTIPTAISSDPINALTNIILPDHINRGTLYQYYGLERFKIKNLIPSIKVDVINFINEVYKANFSYDETVCRRDIAYIVDAITYDLIYNGNTQTTNAALSYSEGSVIKGEIKETVAAYKYWKEIIPYILQNTPVPNAVAGQVVSGNTGNPVPDYYPSNIAQNLIQIIIDTVENGTGYIPEPITESEFNLGDTNLLAFKNTVISDIETIQDAVISYLNNTTGGSINIEIYPGVISVDPNTPVRFNSVSTISTGGTALEYVGSGVTYNALPFFGGQPDPIKERTELNNGRCFTVSNDQVGNFRIGSLFTVNALTGGVTISADDVQLSGLGGIGPFVRDGIPVGVELQEVSNNTNLVSSLGVVDSATVPTQFAVSQYVENRYLNKVENYDGSPQTVAGNVIFNGNVNVDGNITTSNANNISIGNPTLGTLSGAVQMLSTTSLTNGVAQLNQILSLLVPAAPVAFPGGQNLTINSLTQRIMFNSTSVNGTGIVVPAAGSIIYVSRSNTFSTSNITATGPGNRGTLLVNRNNSSAVAKILTYGNTTQVISSVITGTTVGTNVVTFIQPTVGVLVPGYLIQVSTGTFGGLADNEYYYVTGVTSNTLTLSTYNFAIGEVGVPFVATSTDIGTINFTTINDNGTFTSNNTSLVISNNVAYPIETPGFHETVNLTVSGTNVPAGWNTVQIIHSEAGSTTIGSNISNTGIWYYDNSTSVAPVFSSQTFTLNTASITYSSTIPHYDSNTVYDIGFTLTWNPGQTGHASQSTNILTTAAVGPWTNAGNKSYTNLGYGILPSTTTVSSGAGPNATTFRVNIKTGFGAWTTATTVPVYTADNSYTTATTSLPALNSIILYKTGTTSSTSFLDETNIFFNSAVGGSFEGATRCVNPDSGAANQDTPAFSAGSALFDSQNGTIYATDAIVVGTANNQNSLKHDRTNYSTGYLPVGPDLSSRNALNSQYFTFRFVRSGVSKFSITYTTTTGVGAIYCAMPGTGGISGTTSTLNKWLDLRIDNSLANGCALGGNMDPNATGTKTYNCSFGTLSSTNATNNEIWVRIKLLPGQFITSLYLGASTI